jgi:hypothetical protein
MAFWSDFLMKAVYSVTMMLIKRLTDRLCLTIKSDRRQSRIRWLTPAISDG